jgi:hypothetical protein
MQESAGYGSPVAGVQLQRSNYREYVFRRLAGEVG